MQRDRFPIPQKVGGPGRDCGDCHGVGWLDEDDARRIGLTIMGGRTDICQRCGGTGAEPNRRPLPPWARVGLTAVAWVVVGALLMVMQKAGLL